MTALFAYTHRIPRKSVSQSPIQPSCSRDNLRDEVVNEPCEGDTSEVFPIAAEYQEVRSRTTVHGVLLEVTRLLHLQPPNEDSSSRDDTETERQTPDSAEMVVAKSTERVSPEGGNTKHGMTYIHHNTSGTKAAITKPASIMLFVARANHRC